MKKHALYFFVQRTISLWLMFFILYSLFFVSPVFAAEFSSSYHVTYKVKESGITTVINQIGLTNLKSNLYVREYNISIGSEGIENIQGFDSLGNLQLEIVKKEGKTEIRAVFNEKVVGEGKVLTFTISYDTYGIAVKQGRVWEINIPKPSKDKVASSYKITLSVPPSFGQPAYLKPKPAYGLTWTSEQSSSAITVAFGQFQSFDFDLSYRLKNSSLVPGLYQIPLPPDTSYQKVILETLSPLPKNVIVDEDGNWLAQYQLLPQQSIKIVATGSAFVFLEKRPDFPLLNFSNDEAFLSEQKFWEKDAQEIVELAEKLKTPEEIYQYVVKTLSYDADRIGKGGERLGAKKILNEPERATCMEFTDLFIALCRAAGIPAREINGFGFSNNPDLQSFSLVEDVLHSWPEYFDSARQIWVPVDPTWEKTTKGIDYFNNFDFNHFAFVIHGASSETPVAPGAYRLLDEKTKSVKITFSQKEQLKTEAVPELVVNFPQKAVAGGQIKGKITVKNPGPQALYDLSLEVFSLPLSPKYQQFKILAIPPFGQQVIDLNFPSKDSLIWKENEIVFKIGEMEKKLTVRVEPWPIVYLPYLLIFVFLLTILSLSFLLFKKLNR